MAEARDDWPGAWLLYGLVVCGAILAAALGEPVWGLVALGTATSVMFLVWRVLKAMGSVRSPADYTYDEYFDKGRKPRKRGSHN